ncbi:uncharacterized protein LOC129794018 [Lutzomyia longipalpis]|uniref:uncharacterized protein LOC129794018 n=1 Tax=Lutzomyia longipalpis TaxID=7200 RepID=UPI002483A592|nr:uncharacterized protein LOC129794018 [Lutzomyia longipalpis]
MRSFLEHNALFRMPYLDALPGCPAQIPYPDALPECLTRMPCPDALPGCPARMPYLDALPGCPARMPCLDALLASASIFGNIGKYNFGAQNYPCLGFRLGTEHKQHNVPEMESPEVKANAKRRHHPKSGSSKKTPGAVFSKRENYPVISFIKLFTKSYSVRDENIPAILSRSWFEVMFFSSTFCGEKYKNSYKM